MQSIKITVHAGLQDILRDTPRRAEVARWRIFIFQPEPDVSEETSFVRSLVASSIAFGMTKNIVSKDEHIGCAETNHGSTKGDCYSKQEWFTFYVSWTYEGLLWLYGSKVPLGLVLSICVFWSICVEASCRHGLFLRCRRCIYTTWSWNQARSEF